MIQASIFDMDGLLLDTESLALEAWAEGAAELGLELPRAVVVSTIGLDWPSTRLVVQQALPADVSYDELERLVNLYYRQKLESNVSAKPGAVEMLQMLKARCIPAAFATSTPRNSALWRLERAGLLQYFAAGACGDEVTKGKPAPDIFLLAARNLGAVPERCVALEDSPAGLVAAKTAAMTTVMVPDLAPYTPELEIYADYVVKDLFAAAQLACFRVT